MASSSSLMIRLLVLVAAASAASAQLSSTFYDTSCPNALSTIRAAVRAAVAQEARMGASLVRLHFHDCFVQGCDASILLAGNEQDAVPNRSVRGYGVIDNIKTQVEAICNQTVSCADILAVAARDSVVALGGPSWTVQLGRRDSLRPGTSFAGLLPGTATLAQQLAAFDNVGLDATDLVALSGAHTIGQAHCPSYRTRIYNDTNINAAFARSLQANCPAGSGGDNVMAPLDTTTPNSFDNAYFNDLLAQRGLLRSDQELFNGGSTDNIVRNFASSASAFNSAFATAMIKMGNIGALTGTQGEVRRRCSATN